MRPRAIRERSSTRRGRREEPSTRRLPSGRSSERARLRRSPRWRFPQWFLIRKPMSTWRRIRSLEWPPWRERISMCSWITTCSPTGGGSTLRSDRTRPTVILLIWWMRRQPRRPVSPQRRSRKWPGRPWPPWDSTILPLQEGSIWARFRPARNIRRGSSR